MSEIQLQTAKPFTGWHMLAIIVAFFAVVISVNVLMAYYASSSWSGILAKNTYIASQDFNLKAAEARKWAEEGFKGDFKVSDSMLEYRLTGPKDAIAKLEQITAIFHRPVGDKQDFTLILRRNEEGVFAAAHDLGPGQWIVDLAAMEGDKTIYHQAMRFQQPER